jgi:hypothetical protein
VPARLPQNVHGTPALARVTPAPFQPRLELWTSGAPDGTGPRRGLGHLAGADDDPDRLAAMWADAGRTLGPAAIGAPRARREPGRDAATLLERLRAGRAAFGQDWAIVAAPAAAVPTIAAQVRPRVQLDSLPPGLEDEWAARE